MKKSRAFQVERTPRTARSMACRDPVIQNTCTIDPIGGSVSFYDTRVKLEPVVA